MCLKPTNGADCTFEKRRTKNNVFFAHAAGAAWLLTMQEFFISLPLARRRHRAAAAQYVPQQQLRNPHPHAHLDYWFYCRLSVCLGTDFDRIRHYTLNRFAFH